MRFLCFCEKKWKLVIWSEGVSGSLEILDTAYVSILEM